MKGPDPVQLKTKVEADVVSILLIFDAGYVPFKVNVFAPTERVPDVSVKAQETVIELSKVTPLARFIVKLFMAETVELVPGNADGPTITIVPLFSIVPPPVNVPFIVKVTPESTRKVPDETVTLFKV